MKIFWFLYDFILMVLTALVFTMYLFALLSSGVEVFKDFIFIPTFTNLYMAMCSIRLVSKYINNKMN